MRDKKLNQIIDWAQENPDVRTVLLTSSLVNPLAPVDKYSDLDIELVFEYNAKYVQDNSWLKLFGRPIAMVEEDESAFDGKHAMKMVLYEDQVKVDFKLYSVSSFSTEVKQPILCEDWDIGYKVLLDKDGLTPSMHPPSYQVSVIKPMEARFTQLLHDFWWDTTYVAKCLAREDLFYAKFMTENVIRTDYMVPLLEWYIAMQHDWKVTTNKHGRLFKEYLSPALWSRIEQTFADADLSRNWDSLYMITDLVSEIGNEIARKLGYAYPVQLELDVRRYLKEVMLA